MNRPDFPSRKPSQRVRVPHWMALILTPVVFLLGHVAVPQELSLLSARHGWTHGRPGRRNLLGLILIGIGVAGLFWCARLHFVASGGSFEMEHTPKHLVVHGPYQFTRNPMWARPVDGSFIPSFLFMIWRARTLFSLLMVRLLAVRGFDAIQISLRLRQHAFYRKIHRERGMEQFWELDVASR